MTNNRHIRYEREYIFQKEKVFFLPVCANAVKNHLSLLNKSDIHG